MKIFTLYIGIICALFIPVVSTAQLGISTTDISAIDMAENIVGDGVTIVSANLVCPDGAIGTFSNGNTTNLGIDQGILLTTGHASGAIGPNNSTSVSGDNAAGGDADLDALVAPYGTSDACFLEITFVPDGQVIQINYVFGSEEYNEYVCSNFNDIFAFFVNGTGADGSNIALIPGSDQPVSINNVNNGSLGMFGNATNCDAENLANSSFFVDNMGGTTIQYDGFTIPLTATLVVTPGETYTIKLAIGDVGDVYFDSGVFLESESFISININCSEGIISFEENTDTEWTFCTTYLPETIDVNTTSTGENSNYVYLVTDEDLNILSIVETAEITTAGWMEGSYLIWGLTYAGYISGLDVGMNAADISADICQGLSNSLSVHVISCPEPCEVDAGILSTESDTVICDGASEPISAEIQISNPHPTQSNLLLITDEDLMILNFQEEMEIDFTTLELGTYFLWNLAWAGPISGVEAGLFATDISGDCFALSNSLEIVVQDCSEPDVPPIPCYGSEVLEYVEGTQLNGTPIAVDRTDALVALGQPDGINAPGGFVSLGYGGSISILFDGLVFDEVGNDIVIHETSYGDDNCDGLDTEQASIELSQDGITWIAAGTVCRDGFVDIADSGLEYIIAIRIINDPLSNTFDGYDLDGVIAINGCSSFTDEVPGECYATDVVEYIEGTQLNGSPVPAARTNPANALGAPEGIDELVFVTLGYGGSLTLTFNGAVPNLDGDDIQIVETSYNTPGCAAYPEYADVYVSQNGIDFHFARTICKGDGYVDISEAGDFDYVTYVKIVSNDFLTTTPDAFDVDGVIALHNCTEDFAPNNGTAEITETNVSITSYPNPASNVSMVVIESTDKGHATLAVYDMSGRNVATILHQEIAADQSYKTTFPTGNLPNGVYIYQLKMENLIIIDKFIISR